MAEGFEFTDESTFAGVGLGVAPNDEVIFGDFARRLTRGLDPVESQTEAKLRELAIARAELTAYLTDLIAFRRQHPDDGMLHALMATLGPLDLHATVHLLLVAGTRPPSTSSATARSPGCAIPPR